MVQTRTPRRGTILLKKIFEYLLCISMVKTPDLLPWGYHLNTLGEGTIGHPTNQIKAPGLNPGLLGLGLVWTRGPPFEQTC